MIGIDFRNLFTLKAFEYPTSSRSGSDQRTTNGRRGYPFVSYTRSLRHLETVTSESFIRGFVSGEPAGGRELFGGVDDGGYG